MLSAAVFDLDAAAQTSSTPTDSKQGMTFNTMAVETDDTLPYWDLDNTYLERSGGGTLSDGQFYTHAVVLKWRASDTGWRTLFRPDNDHCIIVKDGAKDLGMFSNRNDGFRDSGYDVRAHVCRVSCLRLLRIKVLVLVVFAAVPQG